MKDAASLHDLRGLSVISDLYILMGLGFTIGGIFFLWTLNWIGLVFLGLGLFLAAIGNYLDELRPWAWWAAVLGNFSAGGSLSFVMIDSALQVTTTLFYILIEGSLTIGIFTYLLRPSVRERFFCF